MSFEKFWREFPSRSPHANPRKTAERAWKKQTKNGHCQEIIIEAAKNYAAYTKSEKVERQFICMASTFLNQERFLDHLEKIQQPINMIDVL